jgi:hypothetical protein
MAWATLKYTALEVNAAGDTLIDRAATPEAYDGAIDIAGNWRSCHGFALNTFQMTLRKAARVIQDDALVAQRLKRLPAITHKLERFKKLKLSELQDIAGCRCVMKNIPSVRSLRDTYRTNRMRHRLLKENDYIDAPKSSGYRGIHLIYEYLSEKSTEHNGRQIEMQLRTKLQHAWATAVETAGLFSSQKLKSSQGDKRWLRFFALMGSAVALREKAALVPGTPTSPAELVKELRSLATALEARKKLQAYGDALRYAAPSGRGSVFLLNLDAAAESLDVQEYTKRELRQANAEYLRLEKLAVGKPHIEVVLVAVDDLLHLRTAYPNYYLDTKAFVGALDYAIQ